MVGVIVQVGVKVNVLVGVSVPGGKVLVQVNVLVKVGVIVKVGVRVKVGVSTGQFKVMAALAETAPLFTEVTQLTEAVLGLTAQYSLLST